MNVFVLSQTHGNNNMFVLWVKTDCDVRKPNTPISEIISAWTDYNF